MLPASYVLPLRWSDDDGLTELTGYLRDLSRHVEVLVVDGSDPGRFAAHAAAWAGLGIVHLPPDPRWRFVNGKVDGVTTGVHRASYDAVVIADDDVRWEPDGLRRAVDALAAADLVRPQNYFDPLPWHARWDSARTVLNRAVAADYPGTFAVRRSTFVAMGGYDGDALFENLELIRTVRAAGGREAWLQDLFVRRLPPSTAHFRGQRVRQAYDDLAQPWRLLLWLSVWPSLLAGRGRAAAAWTITTVAVAEVGRRRAGGRNHFSPDASLLAPLWVLERGTCAWLALGARLRGGARYRDGRVRLAAHATPVIRRRLRSAAGGPASGDRVAAARR